MYAEKMAVAVLKVKILSCPTFPDQPMNGEANFRDTDSETERCRESRGAGGQSCPVTYRRLDTRVLKKKKTSIRSSMADQTGIRSLLEDAN